MKHAHFELLANIIVLNDIQNDIAMGEVIILKNIRKACERLYDTSRNNKEMADMLRDWELDYLSSIPQYVEAVESMNRALVLIAINE